ncbi:hypothetical protein GFV12_07745 [Desulfurobacterium thermolithotrophum]|nr:hypothetical protein [Desulfurobacterium thermolithotrophum]
MENLVPIMILVAAGVYLFFRVKNRKTCSSCSSNICPLRKKEQRGDGE